MVCPEFFFPKYSCSWSLSHIYVVIVALSSITSTKQRTATQIKVFSIFIFILRFSKLYTKLHYYFYWVCGNRKASESRTKNFFKLVMILYVIIRLTSGSFFVSCVCQFVCRCLFFIILFMYVFFCVFSSLYLFPLLLTCFVRW